MMAATRSGGAPGSRTSATGPCAGAKYICMARSASVPGARRDTTTSGAASPAVAPRSARCSERRCEAFFAVAFHRVSWARYVPGTGGVSTCATGSDDDEDEWASAGHRASTSTTSRAAPGGRMEARSIPATWPDSEPHISTTVAPGVPSGRLASHRSTARTHGAASRIAPPTSSRWRPDTARAHASSSDHDDDAATPRATTDASASSSDVIAPARGYLRVQRTRGRRTLSERDGVCVSTRRIRRCLLFLLARFRARRAPPLVAAPG